MAAAMVCPPVTDQTARRTYRGTNIEVSFDLDQCIHVGECLRRLPRTFQLHRRPWVAPDLDPADDVAATVERCPSGALQYHRLDGGPDERSPDPATVTPMRNGPLLVRGRIEVRRENGAVEVMPRATLCRCGGSASKPFCDNTHLRNGFRAPGEVFRIELSPVRHAIDEPLDRASDPRGDRSSR